MFKRRPPKQDTKRVRPQIDRRPSKTFSYYASRGPVDPIKRGRNRGKELAAALAGRVQPGASRTQKASYMVGLIILLLVLIYNSVLQTTPSVVVAGKAEDRLLLQDNAAYRAAAENALQDSLTNRSKLTINTASISNKLLSQFPELSAADVSLPLFGHTPLVHITPASSAAIFTATDGRSYVLSDTGRIISANTSAAATGVPSIKDQSGLSVGLGKQALPVNDVTFVTRLLNQLTQQKLQVESLTLPAAGRELDVHIKGQPYFVKFSLEGDVLQQAGAFDATRAQLEAGKMTPTQYIDVRVGDRVYYK